MFRRSRTISPVKRCAYQIFSAVKTQKGDNQAEGWTNTSHLCKKSFIPTVHYLYGAGRNVANLCLDLRPRP